MTMPNFLILGAAKAGTTSLYQYLKQHPQIYLTPIKETNFFALMGEQLDFCGPGDREYINRFSLQTFDAYCAQFEGVTDEPAIGEASPLYLYHAQAPYRIRHHLPDVKLIAILRHPVERAYSAFLHLVRDGREPCADFAQALEEEERRIRSRWEHIWHYKQMGFYAQQLKRYYQLFDRSQINVYLYDALKTNPLTLIRDIFQFLNVDEAFVPDLAVKYNVCDIPKNTMPALLPEVRRHLTQIYEEDILQLQDLLGMDLSDWLAR